MSTEEPEISREQLLRAWVALGSDEAQIGGGLLNFAELVPGHEVSYTRWYEDDHYITGALAWPWVFAGKRWMATKALKAMRFPVDSTLISPITRGSCFHSYLIAHGHTDDVQDLALISLERLEAEGRLAKDVRREHVYSYFQDYIGARYARETGPRDVHALDHPFAHVAMEVLEAPDESGQQALADWALDVRAPELLKRGYDMCLAFSPRNHRLSGLAAKTAASVPFQATRIQLLYFSSQSPEAVFAAAFADEESEVAASGLGEVQFCGPFIPAVPGTEMYIGE